MTSRQALLRRVRLVYAPAMLGSNLLGAVVVFAFLVLLLPVSPSQRGGADHQRLLNTVAFVGYVVVALALGTAWGLRRASVVRRWLASDDPAGPDERVSAQRLPLRQLVVHAVLWAAAALLFGGLNLGFSLQVGAEVAGTVALGGLTTCTLGYLVAERVLRPVVALVMEGSPTEPQRVLGVGVRLLLAWGLGTAAPLVGLGLGTLRVGSRPPLGTDGQRFLIVLGLVVGALATVAAARAVSDPVRDVAAGLRRVGTGDLTTTVPVYDVSEIGQLQSGFNVMVAGLAERDRLRDLFGRQVGTDVARLALEQGVRLGGERREVAVLFVDVIGSTTLAETVQPEDVVGRLNAFFGVVVDVVTARGGWVNKFEGDGALCVFGAPSQLDDPWTRALGAARLLAERLVPLPLEAALGVGGGSVVAGHVGAESRFEYTVVGDPVNAAARLTELAKADPGRVLADASVVDRATAVERELWEVLPEDVLLRGRAARTRVARPRRVS